MLDPDLQEIARKWKESGLPDMYQTDSGVEARRRALFARNHFYPKPSIEVGSVTEALIPGPGISIPVRIVRPRSVSPTGTVIYFHGGGWIVGDLDQYQAHVARIADETDSVVINVDYRLAPEHPFPAGLDDALTAGLWIQRHIDEFGGDSRKLAVAGDSAGGNLAAAVAIEFRNRGIPLAAQFLLYPSTDLTLSPNPDIVSKYLGPKYQAVAKDWRVSPALAESLKGVAPALIGVGKYDYLYEDNLAFARKLRQAGATVILREFPSLNHGFFSYTGVSRVSLDAAQILCRDLKGLLHGRTG